MTTHKDEQLLDDITRNFLKCKQCNGRSAFMLPDDLFDGQPEPPKDKTTGIVNVKHLGLKCCNCGYTLSYENLGCVYSYSLLVDQLISVCSKYGKRHMITCSTCHRKLLVDASFLCYKCHPERDIIDDSQCAKCAIREHPGGEQHSLQPGLKMDRSWAVYYAERIFKMTRDEIEIEPAEVQERAREMFGLVDEKKEMQLRIQEVCNLKRTEQLLLEEKAARERADQAAEQKALEKTDAKKKGKKSKRKGKK